MDQVDYIKKCIQKYNKIRPVGANFGRSLYHNILYEEPTARYISLKDYEFDPYMEGENIICHPNNTLEKVYKVAGISRRMIYGTPFYYPLSIGGIVFNGAVGGHIKSKSAASYVNKLWIVDGNGIDRIIEDSHLKYFLGTFGYLGIAYKISIKTFPEQYMKIEKKTSNIPFKHDTHVTQMIFANIIKNRNDQIIPMISDENKPTYIDIVLSPTNDQPTPYYKLKLQNIKKTTLFILEGIISTFHSAIMSSFMNIFIPINGSVVNSVGLVEAYPLLPKLVLEHVPLNLECGVYVENKNLDKALSIIEKYYKKYFYLNYSCINIIIRKIKTNKECLIDPTYNKGDVDEVVLIDFGFYNGLEHRDIIDSEILELIPYTYSFHLGKYVNPSIIHFMKCKYINIMKPLKNKYDPKHIFSTNNLDYLYL